MPTLGQRIIEEFIRLVLRAQSWQWKYQISSSISQSGQQPELNIRYFKPRQEPFTNVGSENGGNKHICVLIDCSPEIVCFPVDFCDLKQLIALSHNFQGDAHPYAIYHHSEDGDDALHSQTSARMRKHHCRPVSSVTTILRCARSSSTRPKTEREAERQPDRMAWLIMSGGKQKPLELGAVVFIFMNYTGTRKLGLCYLSCKMSLPELFSFSLSAFEAGEGSQDRVLMSFLHGR